MGRKNDGSFSHRTRFSLTETDAFTGICRIAYRHKRDV